MCHCPKAGGNTQHTKLDNWHFFTQTLMFQCVRKVAGGWYACAHWLLQLLVCWLYTATVQGSNLGVDKKHVTAHSGVDYKIMLNMSLIRMQRFKIPLVGETGIATMVPLCRSVFHFQNMRSKKLLLKFQINIKRTKAIPFFL